MAKINERFMWDIEAEAYGYICDAFDMFSRCMERDFGFRPAECDMYTEFEEDGYYSGFLPAIRDIFITKWEQYTGIQLEVE